MLASLFSDAMPKEVRMLRILPVMLFLSVLPSWSFSQNPHIPQGFVLVDDMILPEEVVHGDASFTATPWPSGVVPYRFNANVSTANRTLALNAMAEISAVSGVIFIPFTVNLDWIEFNASNVNNSWIGKQGGGQVINITSWGTKYTIVHEIMHALGYLHEHCRPDRDNFVAINWGNIQSGQGNNFTIVNGATNATAYDFLSVMHYGRSAFSSNGQDTITCHPAFLGFQTQMGNRTYMTLADAQGLQARYGAALVTPSIASIAPNSITTAASSFTLHVYGTNFFAGSPNASGVQGTRIRWNGSQIPTTFVDSGHLTAQISASMIALPQQVQISVINPAPGTNISLGSQTLSVTCQAGALALSNGVAATVTNGCQQFSINPAYSAFNVVGITSASDWDIQMGSGIAAAGGNTCDFVAGSGWFGPGTIQPTTGNVTLYSGSSQATLQHVTSTEVLNGQPTITSMSAGSIVRAFHFSPTAVSTRTIQIAGPTNLNWKLLWAGNSFSWRSSTSNVVAQGQVGAGPVTGIGVVPAPYCLVIYSNGGPIAAAAPLTITMCFDFTPTSLTSSNAIFTANQGPYACVPFNITPLTGKWNVVGVSSPVDWDIQIGGAVSQFGGSSCDYVLANGHVGGISPVTGICSPYTPVGTGGLPGSLQFAHTSTLPTGWYSYTYMILAFEFQITTPGNYDIGVFGAPGYLWDHHRPGTSSAWRRAADRSVGGISSDITLNISNLEVGWHCVVLYHNGGPSGLISPSITVVPSATQAPALASISPQTAAASSGPLTLTVLGSNFSPLSSVLWNGSALPNNYINSTTMTATVSAALLATPGTAMVSVSTTGAGSSNGLPFTIGNPVPAITGLLPNSAIAGSPTMNLTVQGSNFVQGALVHWSGTPLPTTLISAGQLSAAVDASLLGVPGVWPISVVNPSPAGGQSGFAYETVYAPVLTAVTPAAIPLQGSGAPPLTVTVSGNYFNAWSVIHANGLPLPTTFVNQFNLSASLQPALFAQSYLPGALAICVVNAPDAVSKMGPIVVGSGNNAGLIRSHPVAPGPGEPFAVRAESSLPQAALTLIADAGNPVPTNNWPTPAQNLVLGVTQAAGSSGQWLPLVDGLGLFGIPTGAAFDTTGVFTLGGFTKPNPASGLEITIQAAYLDPASPLGFKLTFPLHTFDL